MGEIEKKGKHVCDLRKKLGLTQAEFAEKINISVSYLSNIERGNKNASFKLLTRIKDSFNLSSDWLLQATSQTTSQTKQIDSIELENISQDTLNKPIATLIISIRNFSKGISQLYFIAKDVYNKDIYTVMNDLYDLDFRSVVSKLEKEKNKYEFIVAFGDSETNEPTIKDNHSYYHSTLRNLKTQYETVFFTILDSFYDLLKKD